MRRERSSPSRAIFVLAVIVSLAACGRADISGGPPEHAPTPSAPRPAERSPSADAPTAGAARILVQYDYEPTFFRPEAFHPYGRVPPFTLLADGRAVYVDEGVPPRYGSERAMAVRLTPREAGALVDRVWALGFGRLRSHRNACQNGPDGTGSCIFDASYTILRVRAPDGGLREVEVYADFGPDPHALAAIRDFLSAYRHPAAGPYRPARATLFVWPVSRGIDSPVRPWPLGAGALRPPAPGLDQWATVLAGEDLAALLRTGGRNMGDRYYRHDGRTYEVYLAPWLPGADYTDAVAAYRIESAPDEMPDASAPTTPTAAGVEDAPGADGP